MGFRCVLVQTAPYGTIAYDASRVILGEKFVLTGSNILDL